MKTTLLLACAGRGARAKFEKNKLLVPFDGVTCLERTLSAFQKCQRVTDYVLTVSEEDFEEIKSIVGENAKIVIGGKTRTESIRNGLNAIEDGIVLIHDGARPFVSERIINDCIDSVINYGSGITAIPSRDTICLGGSDEVSKYLGKDELYVVQTPQAFFVNDIKDAYARVGDKVLNDDGEVYLSFIKNPKIVMGDSKNQKLTYPEDFESLNLRPLCRTGTGFDCHRLVEGRKLILGGVEIPHVKGLLGHSDADVLTHAVMDAILAGAGLRDIGYYFSDKDPQYKDADSIKLLERVLDMIKESGYKVQSVSATVMAERPKLLPHIPKITERLAQVIQIDKSNIGVLATTLEGLGFVGREEGICSQATAVLVKI
ncbi:MAG: 2-C-methyl-D-erythritol 2,4-cyclodiphosphate synthase [Clostridiales bacterium]|nr:2-C-methyl-D-erythritol 2,4-cyclodiphosphate synthase [Clostridiales bacterium]